jgi:uncharacterized protein YcfJ
METGSTWVRSALAAGVLAFGVPAVHADSFSEWAPVISATPIVQRVSQPREECWTESITSSETRRLGGISLGAFDTSTNVVVPVTRDVQRCRSVEHYTDVVQGYDVRYRYQGREYVTRLNSDPGDRIRVDVNVVPGVR